MKDSSPALEIRFFNGGHCRQLHALVDRRTWRFKPFFAVFAAVAHPSRGWVLIDTGYSTHFFAATRGWPWRLYALATPVDSPRTTADILRAGGIDPGEINTILLTHFHADHIGGVKDFPQARFIYPAEALGPLLAKRSSAQVRHAFLPGLLPVDFAARSAPVSLAEFRHDPRIGFSTHDVFGDNWLHFVSLPGHAPGHVGVALQTRLYGPLLFAADAYWHQRQVESTLAPMWPARLAISDYHAYRKSIDGLRRLHRTGEMRLMACHCPETQRSVERLRP